MPYNGLAAAPSAALSGTTRCPGDKSISHRALILGALAAGQTTITGLLESADIMATANALRQMGAGIDRQPDGSWQVRGLGAGGLRSPVAPVDFGNSGTGARLLMGVMASHLLRAELGGDDSLSRRPMGRVLKPLARMGALVEPERETLPFTFIGTDRPLAMEYTLPVASAQVKSAILLAAVNTPGCTTVIEPVATRDHTERMLALFGADIHIETDADGVRHISVCGEAELVPQTLTVPGDPSSAAFALVAALLVPGSEITIENVMLNPARDGLFTTLHEMGADIRYRNRRRQSGEEVADLQVRASALRGVDVPPARAPAMIDEYPALAVAAAFAKGKTRMLGLAELRVKESDRLAAIATGLEACGVTVRAGEDSLSVTGGPVPGGALVRTHGDHRIAMAFLMLGLAAQTPVSIDKAAMIDTSFPGFASMMNALGASIEPTVIE
jgi:3-phosphoshikimate 1-carboxyvinyltransferase